MIDGKIRFSLHLLESWKENIMHELLLLVTIVLVSFWRSLQPSIFFMKRYRRGIEKLFLLTVFVCVCVCFMLNCLAATVLVYDATPWNKRFHHDKRCVCVCVFVRTSTQEVVQRADNISVLKDRVSRQRPSPHYISCGHKKPAITHHYATGNHSAKCIPLRKELPISLAALESIIYSGSYASVMLYIAVFTHLCEVSIEFFNFSPLCFSFVFQNKVMSIDAVKVKLQVRITTQIQL